MCASSWHACGCCCDEACMLLCLNVIDIVLRDVRKCPCSDKERQNHDRTIYRMLMCVTQSLPCTYVPALVSYDTDGPRTRRRGRDAPYEVICADERASQALSQHPRTTLNACTLVAHAYKPSAANDMHGETPQPIDLHPSDDDEREGQQVQLILRVVSLDPAKFTPLLIAFFATCCRRRTCVV